MRNAAVLALAFSQPACSFLFVAGGVISSVLWPPAYDAIAAWGGAGSSSEKWAEEAALIGTTAVYLASAIWGFEQTSRCQALRVRDDPSFDCRLSGLCPSQPPEKRAEAALQEAHQPDVEESPLEQEQERQ
jgi:hypothetical protein